MSASTRRPIIGLSGNIFPAEPRRSYSGKALSLCEESMVRSVVDAGGTPVVLPVTSDPDIRADHVHLIDGLLLTGGTDVDPSSYGQPERGWPGQPARDDFEIWLLHRMREAGRPVLGVCRGHQVINVAFGGTLLQDILTDRPSCHVHRDQALYDSLRHPLKVTAGTLICDLFGGKTEVDCNSIHHQAIDTVGEGLVPVAWSDDGLVEALHAPDDAWTWSVQWHPEWDPSPPNLELFRRFVAQCALSEGAA